MPRSILGKKVKEAEAKQKEKEKKEKAKVKVATVINNGGTKVFKNPKIQCEDCKKVLVTDNFYRNVNDPTGYYRICKKCMYERALDGDTHILTKEGLTNLLRLIDRPYVDALWKTVKLKDTNGEAKLGSYLRCINGVSFVNRYWKDSDAEWSITEVDEDLEKAKKYYPDWGGTYTEAEFRYLEKQYEGYKRDFVINDTNQIDYTRKICKASLDLDQCTEGLRNNTCSEQRYKLARETFDNLSKSAKFAKSQRTEDNTLGSFGQVFDLVEKNMWVEPFQPVEEDTYDKLLKQLSNIKRSL